MAVSSLHSGDLLAAPPITSVGLRDCDSPRRKSEWQWCTDLAAERVSLTNVHVARQSMMGSSRSGLSEECIKTITPLPSEWHHLESLKARPDPCPHGTSGPDAAGRQTSGWIHHSSMAQEQAFGMGCHCAGAATNLAASNNAAKYDQLTRTHWNGGYLALTGDWTGRRDRKTHHQNHLWFKRDVVSVSAAVRGTLKRKRSFFSKYCRCQLVRCNPLFALLLNAYVLAWLLPVYVG